MNWNGEKAVWNFWQLFLFFKKKEKKNNVHYIHFLQSLLKSRLKNGCKNRRKAKWQRSIILHNTRKRRRKWRLCCSEVFFPPFFFYFFFFFLSDWKLILSLTCLLLLCLRTALSPVLCLLIALLNEHHQCKVFHLSVQFGREEEAFSKERIILPRHNKELSYVVLFSYLQDCTAGVWFHVCVTVKWTVICYTREKRQT